MQTGIGVLEFIDFLDVNMVLKGNVNLVLKGNVNLVLKGNVNLVLKYVST